MTAPEMSKGGTPYGRTPPTLSPQVVAKDIPRDEPRAALTDAWCGYCRRYLARALFSKSYTVAWGLQGRCKECSSAYHRQWREENRDLVDRYNRERREEYAGARGSLDRVCANPECAQAFQARRQDALYHSSACRDRVNWLRRKARRAKGGAS